MTLVNDPADADTPATNRTDNTAPWLVTGSDADVAIAPGATHRYLVAVEFSIVPAMTDAERQCGQQPQAGNGAYNQAQIRVGNIVTDTAETCIDIPIGEVQITKDVASQTIVDADTIDITYEIDVANASDAPVQYTLTDSFDFGEGVTVVPGSVEVDVDPVAIDLAAGFDGDANQVIAADVGINPTNVHTYTVTVRVDVDLAAAGGADGDCVGTATGLKNDATATIGNRTVSDSACGPFSTLELRKRLINDDGGNAVVNDFQLSAAGTVSFSGTDGVRRIVPAGDYALSETGPAGYSASDWSCTGGIVTGANVTIVDPANVVCTIVNDDEPVDLQLTKSDGGAVAMAGGPPFQYTITVTNVGRRDIDLGEPVTVTDDLPAGLVWVQPAPTGCTIAGQTLTCDIDPVLLTVGARSRSSPPPGCCPVSPVQRWSTERGSPPTTIRCAVPNPARRRRARRPTASPPTPTRPTTSTARRLRSSATPTSRSSRPIRSATGCRSAPATPSPINWWSATSVRPICCRA